MKHDIRNYPYFFKRFTLNRARRSSSTIVSLSCPFLALPNGVRIANVITTSSGFLSRSLFRAAVWEMERLRCGRVARKRWIATEAIVLEALDIRSMSIAWGHKHERLRYTAHMISTRCHTVQYNSVSSDLRAPTRIQNNNRILQYTIPTTIRANRWQISECPRIIVRIYDTSNSHRWSSKEADQRWKLRKSCMSYLSRQNVHGLSTKRCQLVVEGNIDTRHSRMIKQEIWKNTHCDRILWCIRRWW